MGGGCADGGPWALVMSMASHPLLDGLERGAGVRVKSSSLGLKVGAKLAARGAPGQTPASADAALLGEGAACVLHAA